MPAFSVRSDTPHAGCRIDAGDRLSRSTMLTWDKFGKDPAHSMSSGDYHE